MALMVKLIVDNLFKSVNYIRTVGGGGGGLRVSRCVIEHHVQHTDRLVTVQRGCLRLLQHLLWPARRRRPDRSEPHQQQSQHRTTQFSLYGFMAFK